MQKFGRVTNNSEGETEIFPNPLLSFSYAYARDIYRSVVYKTDSDPIHILLNY